MADRFADWRARQDDIHVETYVLSVSSIHKLPMYLTLARQTRVVYLAQLCPRFYSDHTEFKYFCSPAAIGNTTAHTTPNPSH